MKKVAIITGSTRGIGRHIALVLAKNGYNITVTGKSVTSEKKLPGNIYSVSDEIKDLGADAIPIKLDVRNEEEIQKCVRETYNKWGKN
jgi:citronellol/citronellal dehydrogenase